LTEIEGGRSKDRPQLKAALRLRRICNAKLITARLDRLVRGTAMIVGLFESPRHDRLALAKFCFG
jgi:hypothetical protein